MEQGAHLLESAAEAGDVDAMQVGGRAGVWVGWGVGCVCVWGGGGLKAVAWRYRERLGPLQAH